MLSVEDICWLLIYYWQPGKKRALTKTYKFTLKAGKLIWTLKGAHIDGYTNKEIKVEKRKKITNNKPLNLYLPEQRRPARTAQAHHLAGGCVNVSYSQHWSRSCLEKWLRGKYEFLASFVPEKCTVEGEGGGQGQKKKKFTWREGDLGRGR